MPADSPESIYQQGFIAIRNRFRNYPQKCSPGISFEKILLHIGTRAKIHPAKKIRTYITNNQTGV